MDPLKLEIFSVAELLDANYKSSTTATSGDDTTYHQRHTTNSRLIVTAVAILHCQPGLLPTELSGLE